MPYLPMMWLPFLPAAIFDFDFRWITVFFQLLSVAVIMTPLVKIRKSILLIPAILAGAGLFLFLNYFLYKRYDYWGMTEEGVVVCFYLLLGFALLRKNYWLIGLAITVCTLSRYSLVMWLPVYFIFVMVIRPRQDFWKLLVSSGASMLALFIIPFFIRDPLYFIHIPDSYMKLKKHFWDVCGVADHQFYNVGLFKFFSFEQVHTMFVLELLTSFLAPVILILTVKWLAKKTEVNEQYLGFASLKISLIFFFAFIQIPYVYVFVPITLLSYVLLFDYVAGPAVAVNDTKA
ncbi:MAG: hypothetical protein JWO03_985 [Bacteroidetes bacterium]|nr:hypothetical protein [Bacteroidota bacterium]